MHTILDEIHRQAGQAASPESMALPPAYPNGYGGTSSKQTWTSFAATLPRSVPIPIKGMQQVARGAMAGLRSPSLRAVGGHSTHPANLANESGKSVSFDEQEVVHASLPADYPDPSKLLAEEPIDLFSGRYQQVAPRHVAHSQPTYALDSLQNQAVVPSSYTPSSLGIIPELSLDGGSSAEDTDRQHEDGSPHVRTSSVEADNQIDAGHLADEWEGWKLDGIDDVPEEASQDTKPVGEVAMRSDATVAMQALPVASADQSASIAETAKPNKLLSAVSSAAPSPASRDLLGSSPSSLSSSGGPPNTSKKKKQRGKR
jgi:hypothetical protein